MIFKAVALSQLGSEDSIGRTWIMRCVPCFDTVFPLLCMAVEVYIQEDSARRKEEVRLPTIAELHVKQPELPVRSGKVEDHRSRSKILYISYSVFITILGLDEPFVLALNHSHVPRANIAP